MNYFNLNLLAYTNAKLVTQNGKEYVEIPLKENYIEKKEKGIIGRFTAIPTQNDLYGNSHLIVVSGVDVPKEVRTPIMGNLRKGESYVYNLTLMFGNLQGVKLSSTSVGEVIMVPIADNVLFIGRKGVYLNVAPIENVMEYDKSIRTHILKNQHFQTDNNGIGAIYRKKETSSPIVSTNVNEELPF